MADAGTRPGTNSAVEPDWPEFLGRATHALRSPLTAMVAYLELLVEGEFGPLDEAQAEALGVVDEGATQMRRVMDQVVLAARLTAGDVAGEPVPCDLSGVVSESLRECEAAYARRGEGEPPRVELAIDDDLPWAYCDLEAARQIVGAVVENAFDFSTAGSRIDLRLRSDEGAGALRLSVIDRGPGIPEADLPRVTEAFFRASNSAGRPVRGPGLGLFIARRLIEGVGGAIDVGSREGEGTTVELRFPAMTGR